MATARTQTEAEPSPLLPPAAATRAPSRRQGRAPVDHIRAICFAARAVILMLAALRAWDGRHDVSPDGISYLDLSDAVLQGQWAGLVSTYWSPLYPVIIGLTRLALAWTPLGTSANELALVHVVNFALFCISLATFEWMVSELGKTAAGWGNRVLETASGRSAAYVLFGALTLAMSPPSLTTPDLLVNAACFAAFASILRLERVASTANALLLALSLGVGVLAKSFMLPFSVLVLCVVALRFRSRGARAVGVAASAWLILTAPWVAAMSRSTGHFTLGDTGRLNYIWFVDGVQPPNGADLPQSTLVAGARPIVPGLGLIGAGNGTNPLWLDPAPWYRGLRPRLDASRQIAVLKHSLQYYLTLFAPLLLAGAVLIALASAEGRRVAWRRSWPILLPCAGGLLAYALVYSVARYLVPFAAAAALLLGFTLHLAPAPRHVALRAAIALALVLTCEWFWGATRHFVVLPLAMAGALPVYVVLVPRRAVLSIVAAATVSLGIAAVADQCPASWYPLLIIAVVIGTGLAVQRGIVVVGSESTARALRRVAIAAALCALVVRVGRDTSGAIRALRDERSGEDNRPWVIARDLAALGVGPGSHIAVVGSPYDVGWARLGRLHLLGAVPPSSAARYWTLDDAGQGAVSKLFADAGAGAVIAVPPPDTLPRGWRPINGGAVLLLRGASQR